MTQPRLTAVLILPDPIEDTSKGGLHLVKAAPKHVTGIVQAVGDKVESPIKQGDKVLYSNRHSVKCSDGELIEEELIEMIL